MSIHQHLNCVQLNEYVTDPYFLQDFQSNTTVCLIIHMFCKSCEPDSSANQNKNNFTSANLTKRGNNQTNCGIALEILKKI